MFYRVNGKRYVLLAIVVSPECVQWLITQRTTTLAMPIDLKKNLCLLVAPSLLFSLSILDACKKDVVSHLSTYGSLDVKLILFDWPLINDQCSLVVVVMVTGTDFWAGESFQSRRYMKWIVHYTTCKTFMLTLRVWAETWQLESVLVSRFRVFLRVLSFRTFKIKWDGWIQLGFLEEFILARLDIKYNYFLRHLI